MICLTDPTTFMKMLFHSIALRSMTTVSEEKEEMDEGSNAYHVPGTVLVILGNVFFPFSPHNNWDIFLISILPVRKLRLIEFK